MKDVDVPDEFNNGGNLVEEAAKEAKQNELSRLKGFDVYNIVFAEQAQGKQWVAHTLQNRSSSRTQGAGKVLCKRVQE